MKAKIFLFFRGYWQKLVLIGLLAVACAVFGKLSFNSLEYLIRDSLQYLNSTKNIDKSLVTLRINTFSKHGVKNPHGLEGFKKLIDKLQTSKPRYILLMMEPLDLSEDSIVRKQIFDYFLAQRNLFLNRVESRNSISSFGVDPLFKNYPNFLEIELCTETDKKSRRAMLYYNSKGATPLLEDLKKISLSPLSPDFFQFTLDYWETKQAYLKNYKLGTFGNYQSDDLLDDKIPNSVFFDKIVIVGTHDEYSFLSRNSIFNTLIKSGEMTMTEYVVPFQDVVANIINFHTTGDYIKLVTSVNDLFVIFFVLSLIILLKVSHLRRLYLFLSLIPLILIFETILYWSSSFYIDFSRSIALLFSIQYFAVPIFMFAAFKSQEQRKMKEVNDARIDSLFMVSEKVAHDIRSPLSAINLILSRINIENPEFKEILDGSIKRIAHTADNILVKYRTPIEGQTELLEPINIAELVLMLFAEKKIIDPKISFVINLKNYESILILGYRLELERILSNILDNSIFALRNTKLPEIKVDFVDLKDNLLIKILDNGEGIPGSVLNLLGKERVTTKKLEKGSGIALLHAKRVIERMNGTFEVISTENYLTQVSLSLKILK